LVERKVKKTRKINPVKKTGFAVGFGKLLIIEPRCMSKFLTAIVNNTGNDLVVLE